MQYVVLVSLVCGTRDGEAEERKGVVAVGRALIWREDRELLVECA